MKLTTRGIERVTPHGMEGKDPMFENTTTLWTLTFSPSC